MARTAQRTSVHQASLKVDHERERNDVVLVLVLLWRGKVEKVGLDDVRCLRVEVNRGGRDPRVAGVCGVGPCVSPSEGRPLCRKTRRGRTGRDAQAVPAMAPMSRRRSCEAARRWVSASTVTRTRQRREATAPFCARPLARPLCRPRGWWARPCGWPCPCPCCRRQS